MTRLIIFITLSLHILLSGGNFVRSSSVNRRRVRVGRVSDLPEIENVTVPSELGKRYSEERMLPRGSSSRRPRKNSETETSVDADIPNTLAAPTSLETAPVVSAVQEQSNPTALTDPNPIDSFAMIDFNTFDFDDHFIVKPAANSASTKPFCIFDGPFRADFKGQTVVINGPNSPISLEEFQIYFLYLTELHPFFQQLALYPREHFLKEAELALFQVDRDFEGNLPVPLPLLVEPPLHPIYQLAREVLVYSVGKGKMDVINSALKAGMNLNFTITLKQNGLRMNLLHFLLRLTGPKTVEMINFLVKDAKIDPNALDSFGFAPFHYLADCENSFPLAEELIKLGANPNIISARPDFNAPIHIAMKRRNYSFLKPFINLPSVDVNLADSRRLNLVHLAILRQSLSAFTDLLQHPRLVLDFNPLRIAFCIILTKVPASTEDRFLDALTAHVVNRKGVHASHFHYAIFQMILAEYVAALKAFHRQKVDFSFVHKSEHGRPDSTPLSFTIRKDRLNSFIFFESIGLLGMLLTENLYSQSLVQAVSSGSTKILSHLLEKFIPTLETISECIRLVLQADRADLLKIFIDKFGMETISPYLASLCIEEHPVIFTFLACDND